MHLRSLIRRPAFYFTIVGLSLMAFWKIHAAGTVTNCTEANLDAAMSGGGLVNFSCDGIITITTTKNNSTDTILDGTRHTGAINANNAVRPFTVHAAGQFSGFQPSLGHRASY